jgi:hypothetical protein
MHVVDLPRPGARWLELKLGQRRSFLARISALGRYSTRGIVAHLIESGKWAGEDSNLRSSDYEWRQKPSEELDRA